jgi:hypothetical protein
MVRKSRSITPIPTLGANAVEVVAAADIEAVALAAVAAEDLVAIDEEAAVAMEEAEVVAEEADLEVDVAAAVVATTATRKDISLANALRAVEVATTDPVSKLESSRVAPQIYFCV